MAKPFRTSRRVEFCETDAAGIAHFAAFFNYMEQAEHALLRELGHSVLTADDQGPISWPRVAAKCDYTRPARFEDVLDVEVVVARLGRTSVAYEFHFSLGGEKVASGSLTAVCCRLTPGAPPRPIEIPPALRAGLESYAP